jgi:hypothetical protein
MSLPPSPAAIAAVVRPILASSCCRSGSGRRESVDANARRGKSLFREQPLHGIGISLKPRNLIVLDLHKESRSSTWRWLTRTKDHRFSVNRGSASVAHSFVRDVIVAVEIVVLARPPQVIGRVFVAEALLFGRLGLRWRARRILVGIEWKSRHWGTSEMSRSNL